MKPESPVTPKVTLFLTKPDKGSKGLLRFEFDPVFDVKLAARLVGLLLVLKLARKLHLERGGVPEEFVGRISFGRIAAVLDRDAKGYRLCEKTIESYIFQIRKAIRKAADQKGIEPPVLLISCGDKSIRLACELHVLELDEQVPSETPAKNTAK